MIAPPIELGCVIWSRTRAHGDDAMVGGTVVEVLDDIDHDTGEISCAYRVVDHYRGQLVWRTIPADDVAGDMIEPPSSHKLIRRAREMWRDLSVGKGPLTSSEVHHESVAHRLVAEVMSP